jgi:hypothetical protein
MDNPTYLYDMKEQKCFELSYRKRSFISALVWFTLMGGWIVLVATILDYNVDHKGMDAVAYGAGIMTIIVGTMFALTSMWVSDKIDSMFWKRKQKRKK